jgi:hypothetical protein
VLSASSAPGIHFTRSRPRNVIAPDPLQVFILLGMIPFRMNTYSVVEASLKTRHFNPFRMRTYAKSARNSIEMNTYKKPQGGGAPAPENNGTFPIVGSNVK